MNKDDIYQVIVTLKSKRATKLDGTDKMLLHLNDKQKEIILNIINENCIVLKDEDGEFVGYVNVE